MHYSFTNDAFRSKNKSFQYHLSFWNTGMRKERISYLTFPFLNYLLSISGNHFQIPVSVNEIRREEECQKF